MTDSPHLGDLVVVIPLDDVHSLAIFRGTALPLPRLLDKDGVMVAPLPGTTGTFAGQLARKMPATVAAWLPHLEPFVGECDRTSPEGVALTIALYMMRRYANETPRRDDEWPELPNLKPITRRCASMDGFFKALEADHA